MRRCFGILLCIVAVLGCGEKAKEPPVDTLKVNLSLHVLGSAKDVLAAEQYGFLAPTMGISMDDGVISYESNDLYEESRENSGASVYRLHFKRLERPLTIVVVPDVKYNSLIHIWVDYDEDRVLDSDEEMRATSVQGVKCFGPLRSRGREGEPVCYLRGGPDLTFLPVGWMRGETRLGGVNNVVIVIDANLDGEYGPWTGMSALTDWLVVRPDGADDSYWRERDGLHDGRQTFRQLSDGLFFSVAVSNDGKTATFQRVKSVGTLTVTAQDAEVISNMGPPRYIRLQGGSVEMPVGDHSWIVIQAALIDVSGSRWKVTWKGGETDRYTISAGSTTKIEVGPPVKAHAAVKGDRNSTEFEAYLVDEFGHAIDRIIGPDGKEVPAKLVISNKDGIVIDRVSWADTTSIRFSSGGGYGLENSPLTYTVSWDVGAFGRFESVAVLRY